MAIKICPRCQQSYTVDVHTTDFIHDCHSGSATLDQEDVVLIGDWVDYTTKIVPVPTRHYKMNDNLATTVVIDSMSKGNGTSVNNTDTMSVAGKINEALQFDGSTEYVTLNDPADLDFVPDKDEFSVCAWIKIDAGNTGTVISKAGLSQVTRTYQILISSDIVKGVVGGTPVDSVFTVADGTWHHVALVNFDDDGTLKFKMYMDGIPDEDSITTSGSGQVFSIDTLIGARRDMNNTDSKFEFNGDIDDVRIFNVALSVGDVQGLFNKGAGTEIQDIVLSAEINNPLMQGAENKLWGTRAAIEGETTRDLTDRGAVASTHRQREHLEFIELEGGDSI